MKINMANKNWNVFERTIKFIRFLKKLINLIIESIGVAVIIYVVMEFENNDKLIELFNYFLKLILLFLTLKLIEVIIRIVNKSENVNKTIEKVNNFYKTSLKVIHFLRELLKLCLSVISFALFIYGLIFLINENKITEIFDLTINVLPIYFLVKLIQLFINELLFIEKTTRYVGNPPMGKAKKQKKSE